MHSVLIAVIWNIAAAQNDQSQCVSPYLAPSEHSTVTLPNIGQLDCFYECREDPIEFYYIDHSEMDRFKIVILVLSIISLIVTIALCCNLCVGHFDSNAPFYKSKQNENYCTRFIHNFKNRPFLYDIPWMLQIGYFLINKSLLIPSVASKEDILCSKDENIMIDNMRLTNINTICLFTAIYDIMGTHIIGIYKTALSIALYQSITDTTPYIRISRCVLHIILWIIICLLTMLPIVLETISADWLFNICKVGDHYPLFLVIPITIYAFVICVFLTKSIFKLRQHITKTSGQQISHQRKMKKFMIRVVLFSVFTVGALIGLVIIPIMVSIWTTPRREALNQMIECRLMKGNMEVYKANFVIKDECQNHKMEVYQSKFVILYSFYPVFILLLVLSGFILSMTDRNMKYWKCQYQRATNAMRQSIWSQFSKERINDLSLTSSEHTDSRLHPRLDSGSERDAFIKSDAVSSEILSEYGLSDHSDIPSEYEFQ